MPHSSHIPWLSGSLPALITPFDQDKIDFDAFSRILMRVSPFAKAVVIAGSTGEGVSLSTLEKEQLTVQAKELVGNDIKLIVGIGAATTRQAMHQIDRLQQAGADAFLVSPPYYLCPSEQGIFQHFQALSRISEVPLILYNIPKRTGLNLSLDLITRLAEAEMIIALKEAGQNIERLPVLVQTLGDQIALLCGDDHAALTMRQAGAVGCISVIANLYPELSQKFHDFCDQEQDDQARIIDQKFQALAEILALEPNPQGIKYAMSQLGYGQKECRLPLISASRRIAGLIDQFKADHVRI